MSILGRFVGDKLVRTAHQWREIETEDKGAPEEVVSTLNHWPDEQVDFFLFGRKDREREWIVFRVFDDNGNEIARYAAPILLVGDVEKKP